MKPVGKEEQPDVVLEVDIKVRGAKKNRVSGRLRITQGVNASERSVTGVSCAEVSSALSLIAALAIDPSADEIAKPEPLPVPPNPFGPPILGSEPQLILGPAPVIVPFTVPPLPLRPGMMPPPWRADLYAPPLPARPFGLAPHGIDFGIGARFVLEAGPAPTVLAGVAGAIELRDLGATGRIATRLPDWADPNDRPRGPAWSIRAELSYAVTTESKTFGAAETGFRMLRGRFIACVPGYAPASWLRVWPCASFGGGGEWAQVTQDGASRSLSAPWVELGVSGRVDWVPVHWLAFEVQVGPALAVVDGQFANGSTIYHDPFPVAFQLGTGATASF